tara:strand:- start:339 stop:1106 length:768 start_codon:yes stop_codon:yes gene_type:complete
MGKYFTVEVKPVMTPVNAGLNAAFGDGDVLFDWTSFNIPKGAAKLIGITAEIRPKGDSGSTPNIFPFELLFAKSKLRATDGELVAPTTLGALNSAPAASAAIQTQTDMYIGHAPIVAGDFGVTDQLAVASAAAPEGLVLEGHPNSGINVGYDMLYVGGIAGGAFNFVSETLINNGDLDGPTMTTDGTDPRLFIAAGDTVAVCTDADNTATKAMGIVDSMTATSIVLTEAFTTADVANNDIVYNTSPIRLMLTFEK